MQCYSTGLCSWGSKKNAFSLDHQMPEAEGSTFFQILGNTNSVTLRHVPEHHCGTQNCTSGLSCRQQLRSRLSGRSRQSKLLPWYLAGCPRSTSIILLLWPWTTASRADTQDCFSEKLSAMISRLLPGQQVVRGLTSTWWNTRKHCYTLLLHTAEVQLKEKETSPQNVHTNTHTHTQTHQQTYIYIVVGARQILGHRIKLPYLYLEHI